jgi:predicted DNA-binding transcriptional regulator AlpA
MLHVHSDAQSLRWGPQVSDEALIPSAAMRAQYLGGCSEMHVWRLLNDGNYQALAFPQPIKINGRNYWRLGEIRRWIMDQEARSRKQVVTAVPHAAVSHPSARKATGNITSSRKSRRARPMRHMRAKKPQARAQP